MKTVERIAEDTVPGELNGRGLAGYFVATAYNLVRMANLVSRGELGPVGRSDRGLGVAVRP